MNTDHNSTPGELLVSRILNAPRRIVFDAWTDQKHLAQWWGPHGFTNPRCEWDVRPGGKIHVDMRGPNGVIYPMFGAYREIVEPERLVFTSGALDADGKPLFEILNTVTFTEEETGKTKLTLRTRVLSVTEEAGQYLNGHKMGWSQSLERLEDHMKAMQEPVAPGEATPAAREILIAREFDAPRELVWQAMTRPEHVVNWWGPRGFTTTIEEMDVRPGGAWKHVLRGPDGTDYPNECIFTEVARPERIAFSNGGGKAGGPVIHFTSTWTFDALEANRTKVTIHMVFSSAADRNRVVEEYGAIEGGKQTLERLGEQLVAAPVIVERTFDAPAETVWEALTDKEHMKHWFFELEEFKPEAGFQFQFIVEHQGTTYDHRCEVTEVIPAKKLAYTWRYEGYEGNSLVTFELFAEGGRTRLKLTHEGLHSFPNTPAYAKSNFLQGWTAISDALGEFVSMQLSRPG